jgi:glycosyltransferase involved in cell wall biosynthesis
MKLSIVVPVMNEEDNIKPMIDKISESIHDMEYEVVFVDDGSSDGTIDEIKKYANENTKLVVFSRNFGQTSAMAAGIEVAEGEYIATIDGDLQNDPSDIAMMIQKLENEGYDVVAGRRKRRQDGMILRKIPSKIANWLIRRWTKADEINDYGCTLKVFKSDIAKSLGLYGELHRFIPVLAKLNGAKICEVDVKHHARVHGESKYGIGRTFKVASDLLLMVFFIKYQQKPIHLFGGIGIPMFLIGALIDFYLLILKLFGADIGGRPLFFVGNLMILGGIQLITTGFIAELIMRTYFESQNRKPYLVKEVIKFKEEDKK